jgi:hypothetical protein
LSEAEWREIRGLVADGKAHPDPAVAQAALDWARQETRGRVPIVGWMILAAAFALDALSGGLPALGSSPGGGHARDTRRLARRIDRVYSKIVGHHGSFLPRERISVDEIAAWHIRADDEGSGKTSDHACGLRRSTQHFG